MHGISKLNKFFFVVLSRFSELLDSDDFGFTFMDCCYKQRLFLLNALCVADFNIRFPQSKYFVSKYQVISKICMSHNHDFTLPILCCTTAKKLFKIMIFKAHQTGSVMTQFIT